MKNLYLRLASTSAHWADVMPTTSCNYQIYIIFVNLLSYGFIIESFNWPFPSVSSIAIDIFYYDILPEKKKIFVLFFIIIFILEFECIYQKRTQKFCFRPGSNWGPSAC